MVARSGKNTEVSQTKRGRRKPRSSTKTSATQTEVNREATIVDLTAPMSDSR